VIPCGKRGAFIQDCSRVQKLFYYLILKILLVGTVRYSRNYAFHSPKMKYVETEEKF